MSKRLLIGAVVALALLVGTAGVLYAFGTPVRPAPAVAEDSPTSGVPVPAESGLGAASGTEKATPEGAALPAPDPSSPLAIEIPGCVCHSDDPELVKEHEGYRMNQCAGCHAGGVPTGQE